MLCDCGFKQEDSIADFSLKDSANANHALAVSQRIKVTISCTATVSDTNGGWATPTGIFQPRFVRFNVTFVGETGINAALCGAWGCPVLLVTGDEASCREGRRLLGDRLTTVAVKQGRILALCFHPELTDDLRLHREFVRLAARPA